MGKLTGPSMNVSVPPFVSADETISGIINANETKCEEQRRGEEAQKRTLSLNALY